MKEASSIVIDVFRFFEKILFTINFITHTEYLNLNSGDYLPTIIHYRQQFSTTCVL